MERIVYLLGAGFSAPLGLPVMGNFLEKSKDIFFADKEAYEHFAQVFDTIRDLSVAKNYYTTDLFNIEEILSIIEMQEHLGGQDTEQSFLHYISDVISHFTPEVESYRRGAKELPGNWYDWIFGGRTWAPYGLFVASLFGTSITVPDDPRVPHLAPLQDKTVGYDVITLNYDLVLENVVGFINDKYEPWQQLQFGREASGSSPLPYLSKLHGSVDTGVIVPPTWNKGLGREDLHPSWELAYDLLMNANHIRVIGYSLPVSDSYIKYLLRAAVIHSLHLKSLDVICLDWNGEVRSRYDDFIVFKNYRFVSANVEEYLGVNRQSILEPMKGSGRRQKVMRCNKLEESHANFFAQHSGT